MSHNTLADSASRRTRKLDDTEEIERRLSQTLEEIVPVSRGSLIIAIAVTLLLRITGRTSFVILSFYLGEHFASAGMVALILESFYVSELLTAPLVGSLSDRLGRRPFLLLSPLLAIGSTVCLFVASQHFPHPGAGHGGAGLLVLLLIILAGRLLEGAAAGMNVPATLGYLTDATVHSERIRARVVTAFEIATVGGLVLALPIGGRVSSWLGTRGFLIVIVLYSITLLLIAFGMGESMRRSPSSGKHRSLWDSFLVIRHLRIFTFLPAWFSVNALVGAWTVLITIMLAYPNPAADRRHPHQLLYGGFDKMHATLWVGLFALIFLVGMGLWTPFLSRIRRTTVMLAGLSGLGIMFVTFTIINSLAENPASLPASAFPLIRILLVPSIAGVLLLSGFTPVSLTQMSAIAETLPGKRGAVMGLYSVVLALGQLLGAAIGGFCVDLGGFYGLIGFSVVMGLMSLGSVLYIRSHGHDYIKVPSAGHG